MQSDPQTLLRGLGKLVAVVVGAIVGGAGIGIGLAELTTGSRDTGSPPPAVTGSGTTDPATSLPDWAARTPTTPRRTPTTTVRGGGTTAAERSIGAASAGGRLRVEVISAIAHPVTTPAGAAAQRARVGVHARVTNGTGRVVRPAPVLIVGDARVRIPPSSATGPLLAPLAPGSVVDGTLRFDTEGVVSAQGVTGPVRLRIVGKILALAPKVGSPLASG